MFLHNLRSNYYLTQRNVTFALILKGHIYLIKSQSKPLVEIGTSTLFAHRKHKFLRTHRTCKYVPKKGFSS